MALVSKLSTAARRVVLGRPFRSDWLCHTVLPTRIALPVFASDALSSVARSFSSGCAALTGVEAISNGVPAFRKPKSRNAERRKAFHPHAALGNARRGIFD